MTSVKIGLGPQSSTVSYLFDHASSMLITKREHEPSRTLQPTIGMHSAARSSCSVEGAAV